MKRALFLVLAIALAGALLWFTSAESTSPADDRPRIEPTATAEQDEATTASESDSPVTDQPIDEEVSPSSVGSLAQPLPPADARAARVLRLADGDSFDIVWLDTDERDEVRMFGVNAPEGGACFGDSARDVLEVLTKDQDLLVESIERDEFGRVLGNVWVGDLFVNATMVELGAALALSDGGRYATLITQSQSLARDSGVGLWDPAACGSDPATDVRIAWIEADAPGRDDQNKNGEWIAIENAGTSPADMTDWSIRDESTRHRFFFPDGHTIPAGSRTTVFSGCGDDTADELYWCDADPVWNNGGDTGFLVDPEGRFADSRSYGG